MYRCVVVVLMLLFDDYPIKVGPYVGDLLEPVRLALSFPVAGTHCLAELLENEFRAPTRATSAGTWRPICQRDCNKM